MMKSKRNARGFTLIATLLLLLLMSGIAIGMLMMVNTEVKVGTQDLQNNATFHASEGAIEQMTANLANTFKNIQSPTVGQITALDALAPANTAAISYPVYTLTPATDGAGNLLTSYGQVASGQNGGLYAQLLPITLQATAQGPLGDEVNMSRTVEVALIPVFQFGIFSDSDLSFFAGPNFAFGGRVHTNGDLYLAEGDGSTLTFNDKLSAYGNVVRFQLANTNGLAVNGYNGTVDVPNNTNGCPGVNCRALDQSEGSVVKGPTSAYNDGSADVSGLSWQTLSLTNYAGYVIDGDNGNTKFGTGATQLNLPFINGANGALNGPQQYEIIRQPPAGEAATSPLGASRLYNLAQIHVLLADDPSELPGGAGDANNVRLANVNDADNALDYSHGVQQTSMAKFADGGFPAMYFATANSAIPNPVGGANYWSAAATAVATDWEFGPLYKAGTAVTTTLHDPVNNPSLAPYLQVDGSANASATTNAPQPDPLVLCNPSVVTSNTTGTAPYCPDALSYPYFSTAATATVAADPPLTLPFIGLSTAGVAGASVTTVSTANTSTWNLLDGYLRVEYKDAAGNWNPATQEWLQLGFARGLTPPTAPGTNPVNPNAILILQQPADQNGDGNLDQVGLKPSYTSSSKSTTKTTSGPPCLKMTAGVCTKWTTTTTTTTTYTYTPSPGKPPEVIADPMSASPWYGDSTLVTAGSQSPSQYNWYPINFYDPREGEIRDINKADASCTPVGVMNAVELDVGNLQQWLAGKIGANGGKVDYLVQNGYVLYFSDRRGMLKSPNGTQVAAANTKTGDSGLEDDVNSGNAAGTPDGALEANSPGKKFSAEDFNLNGKLDNFGSANLGLGFGYNVAGFPATPVAGGTVFTAANQINNVVNAAAPSDPYMTGSADRINSCTVAQKNWVSGARHVLKLVDGQLGNVPLRPDNAKGGFTVGSENPVYVVGDYNSNAGDPMWGGGKDAAGMAAAAVIADTVTLLSDNWRDWNSLLKNPTTLGNRTATTSYYRMAIAAGKNINFTLPGGGWAAKDYGTDGGVHNFLRYIENWGGQTLNYKGSIVSLFYSNYNTGVYKCCTVVYSPPVRGYSFDTDFSTPAGLPPGTPLFRDIDNLSYRQNLTACTVNTSTGVCSD